MEDGRRDAGGTGAAREGGGGRCEARREAGAQLPQPRSAVEDEKPGRGLILVRALAASWGVRPTDEGKTTWFTLRL
ncbi:ATP-binding protein [Streptomyces sp. NPDC054884]|uniref:ATP-binding protein n=1 Tax=Streptomyces sp. ME08-AFT2 TaxID=3028683 RepID=UPI0029A0C0CC|nr:ATP-binding protein [Streptomyces sp. ME08-AFT2]MDX3308723.1 ATP-binding protein [Streptomyces sp. ME08-AFT2]